MRGYIGHHTSLSATQDRWAERRQVTLEELVHVEDRGPLTNIIPRDHRAERFLRGLGVGHFHRHRGLVRYTISSAKAPKILTELKEELTS